MGCAGRGRGQGLQREPPNSSCFAAGRKQACPGGDQTPGCEFSQTPSLSDQLPRDPSCRANTGGTELRARGRIARLASQAGASFICSPKNSYLISLWFGKTWN